MSRSKRYVLIIQWDISGKSELHSISASYIKSSHGFLILFDITDLESFAEVKPTLERLATLGRADKPVILVGTKADLFLDRKVSYIDA